MASRWAQVTTKGLVLDANILLRAVFGLRVLDILERHEDTARFVSPDVCFQEALKYIPAISKRRGLNVDHRVSLFHKIASLIEQVDRAFYEQFEIPARERIEIRDPSDWPVLAVALLLDLPIWTEDQDFFGAGIATWTTDRVELYLQKSGGG